MPKRILILGGGTGGVVSALFLSEQVRGFGFDAEITLVNKDEWHYMPPLWMDVALEGIPLDETRAPIRNLEKYGVRVVVDEAVKIDPANRRVSLAGGDSLEYDYLIVALGSRNGWEAYPGLAEAGYHNYDPEGAVEFNKALREFPGGRVVILVPEMPYRCGTYPMEFATVLGYRLATRGINPDITLVVPMAPNGATPVEGLGPDIAKLWLKYFEKYNVKVIPHKGFERVDPGRNVVVTKNNEIPYDLLVKVPPLRLPKVLEDPEFVYPDDNRFTKSRAPDFRHPDYDDIFMIGEHAMEPTGLSTAGVFIHVAAHRASSEILYELGGSYPPEKVPPVACVAYSGDKGFLGVCEIEYDTSQGKYTWRKCYNALESGMIKLVKRAFYQGWLNRLRF
ncbi:MAG: FAD-dependent oxidoreductase [Desulfurococcales archaeon]|nr:FAD-dependent oxidoreductase [Desulfurococcales archaeon]